MSWPAAVVIALVACGLLAAYFAYRRLLYLERPPERLRPDGYGVPYEDVSFTSSDGVTIRGWFFPLPAAHVIVYCPGRGRGLNHFDFRYAPLFQGGGYQVLMFDWRGMGASGGRSSIGYWEQLDLKAAVAYVRGRAPSARIGAIGTSLGAAVVFLASGDIPEIAAAAGECAFSTFERMISDGFHVLYGIPRAISRPTAWLLARIASWRRGFPLHGADPVLAIGRISPRPVFIAHGAQDHHVPVDAGLALYAAAGEPKFIWTPESAHTSALEDAPGEYRRRLLDFFDTYVKNV